MSLVQQAEFLPSIPHDAGSVTYLRRSGEIIYEFDRPRKAFNALYIDGAPSFSNPCALLKLRICRYD